MISEMKCLLCSAGKGAGSWPEGRERGRTWQGYSVLGVYERVANMAGRSKRFVGRASGATAADGDDDGLCFGALPGI